MSTAYYCAGKLKDAILSVIKSKYEIQKNIILGKPFKNCDICYIEGGRVKIRTNIILVKNVPLKTNKVSNKLKFKKCICIYKMCKKFS